MAERPRRSARVPKHKDRSSADVGASSTALPVVPRKRKATSSEASHDDLDFLLRSQKSPLVNLELSTLINEQTWGVLSQDSRALLSTMVPPAFFSLTQSSLPPHHPANRHRAFPDEQIDPIQADSTLLASEPDLSLFTDPFFEAAAKTFQDHLHLGWHTLSHEALLQEYEKKIRLGDKHAPWKDERWHAAHPAVEWTASAGNVPAGELSSLTLSDLAKHSIVRVGDVLAYRRSFSPLNITVTKDALIKHIHPTSRSLTVLVAPSTQTHLPRAELKRSDIPDDALTSEPEYYLQEMTIASPSQLEGALLDIDGRIPRTRRPNGNAWKCFGVWRWRDVVIPVSAYAEGSDEAARGGREYQGTLFYLRGCSYDDQ